MGWAEWGNDRKASFKSYTNKYDIFLYFHFPIDMI
jgi:hypothetical protein